MSCTTVGSAADVEIADRLGQPLRVVEGRPSAALL
jgi:hypothetical protein